MTTIENLTLVSNSPASYNSGIRELAKCAASELEALQRKYDDAFSGWQSYAGRYKEADAANSENCKTIARLTGELGALQKEVKLYQDTNHSQMFTIHRLENACRILNSTDREKEIERLRDKRDALRAQNRELGEALKSIQNSELRTNEEPFEVWDRLTEIARQALGLKTGDIEMKSTIEQVKEFHDAFSVSSDLETRRKNSVEFMWSELDEFQLAENDVERLDALLDLQYMLDGTFLAYGWEKIKDAAFAEVHRSNMTKLQVDGTPLLRADGKVLKGPGYEPPRLEQFL